MLRRFLHRNAGATTSVVVKTENNRGCPSSKGLCGTGYLLPVFPYSVVVKTENYQTTKVVSPDMHQSPTGAIHGYKLLFAVRTIKSTTHSK